jgi:hypothetical protein
MLRKAWQGVKEINYPKEALKRPQRWLASK